MRASEPAAARATRIQNWKFFTSLSRSSRSRANCCFNHNMSRDYNGGGFRESFARGGPSAPALDPPENDKAPAGDDLAAQQRSVVAVAAT
jgi:hypothetical protein